MIAPATCTGVSKWTRAEHQNWHEAETACKAEQADTGFTAAHGDKTFAQFYGDRQEGHEAVCPVEAVGRVRRGAAGQGERCPSMQGGAQDVRQHRLQGEVRYERERVRQVRLEAGPGAAGLRYLGSRVGRIYGPRVTRREELRLGHRNETSLGWGMHRHLERAMVVQGAPSANAHGKDCGSWTLFEYS